LSAVVNSNQKAKPPRAPPRIVRKSGIVSQKKSKSKVKEVCFCTDEQ